MDSKYAQSSSMANNSRTCNSKQGSTLGGFKLFGVQLHASSSPPNTRSSSSRRSVSLDFPVCSTTSSNYSPNSSAEECSDKVPSDHILNGPIGLTTERKKGVPWTEREHMLFLLGLEKLGRGDWRGISRSFVCTRSPTQVASHAQKYFLRLASVDKKKRRSRLFDTDSLLTCPNILVEAGSSGMSPSLVPSPSDHDDCPFDLNVPDASTHFLASSFEAKPPSFSSTK